MKSLMIPPISKVDGSINLPGSKSISNRALLLSALAKGNTTLYNLLDSDDVHYMLSTLKTLGIQYLFSENRTRCTIFGNGGLFNVTKKLNLFLGNAGTVMRLLTATLSLCPNKNNIVLTGESRMKKRPIGHLVDALRQGGAKIDYLEQECYPPLQLHSGFRGCEIVINGSISSQFLSALLIAAPLASNDTLIKVREGLVSKPYVDITLSLIHNFNVEIKNQSYHTFIIRGQQQYRSPGDYPIEGDASSASYFLAAAAIKGGTVKVKGIGNNSIQGDVLFAGVLKRMGAIVTLGEDYISCTRSELNGIDIDTNHIPDAAMTLAMAALFARGSTILRNIYNWRLKETDRLFAMSRELRKIGAFIKEGKDYICITPPTVFQFAKINTYNDHRIAMCFSLVSLSGTPVVILNPECTKKTFPSYFAKFIRISALS